MTVLKLKTKKTPTDLDIKSEDVIRRLRNSELTKKDAANQLFHLGHSVETAWQIAQSA